MKKKLTAIACMIMTVSYSINVFAGVFGNLIEENHTSMGGNTEYYTNVFQKEKEIQREYYVEYTPNEQIVPVVVNGDEIYGKRTVREAVEYMKKNNMKPMMGINGDYFSFKTGIPMGHTIIDGELVTMDPEGQNAVGFNSDGTGFISWLQIQSRFIKEDGTYMYLDCLNKWCQPTINTSYLLSDMFGKSTKTSGNCKFIIFSKVDGRLKIGDSIKLRVDEKFDYDGEISIPENKYVLVMTNTYGIPEKLSFMDSLKEGDVLELKTESVYDAELWNNAENGMGSVGGRLIENGKVNSYFEAGTAPRTAVGIKEDGSIIFYVVDGRQPGFSNGVEIKTLARRMEELGCVDALNLDGGGSTVITGVFPGSDEYSVLNSPSEGTLRKCANYIFLKDMRTPTGDGEFFDYNISDNRNFLSGYTEEIDINWIVDTGGYYVDKNDISYNVTNSEYTNISADGNKITLRGNGQGYVTVSAGNGSENIMYDVFETPDRVQAEVNGRIISEIKVDGKTTSFDINPVSYIGEQILVSDDSCYSYSCDNQIGTIDRNGVFTPNISSYGTGSVYIRAGEYTLSLPIVFDSENKGFTDTVNHWSGSFVSTLANMGIVTGEKTDKGYVYRPDDSISRGEFAVIVARYLNLDLKKNPVLDFDDKESIPEWMRTYAQAVSEIGIINGKEVNGKVNFAASDTLTRAEAIAIIGRAEDLGTVAGEINFSDSNYIPSYAKVYVNQLSELGIINGYSDGSLRPSGKITRGECAKVICKCIELL